MASKVIRRTPGAKSTKGGNVNGTPHDAIDDHSSIEEINEVYGDNALPEGYAAASTFGVTWNHLIMPILVGHVDDTGVSLVETPDPNSRIKGATRWSQKITVITEDGKAFDVWESASLKNFFKRVTPGAEVAIVFKGKRASNKAGRADIKMFVGGFKGGALPPVRDDAPPEDWDGSYNYLTGETNAPAPAPAPAKYIPPTKRPGGPRPKR